MPTISVYLPDEAVDVWRPVEAVAEDGSIYRIGDTPIPPGEVWQFPPRVPRSVEWRELADGPAFVAVAPA